MIKKPTILYVDDEPINLMLFKINFKKKYEVITAKDGYSGLEQLEKVAGIQAVLSDMKMPGMNGIEFITKAKEKYADTKFFMLSGFETTPEIERALKTGLILKYFRKPFDKTEITRVLEETICL